MIQKMKKSKGFTLIEMLVVIAIIAVLVAIIIPVVSNSTEKAQAAADAANLRSVKAELVTQILTGAIETSETNTTMQAAVDAYVSTNFADIDWHNGTFGCTVGDDGDVEVYLTEGTGESATKHTISSLAGDAS